MAATLSVLASAGNERRKSLARVALPEFYACRGIQRIITNHNHFFSTIYLVKSRKKNPKNMERDFLLDTSMPFREWDLDPRLKKAILHKLQFSSPTVVQAKALPLALTGKDILLRARTGSGKTAAYSIPIVQKLLCNPTSPNAVKGVRALVLVPTRELCTQVQAHFQQLTHYCKEAISVVALAHDDHSLELAKLNDIPEIVVATPSRAVAHLRSGVGTIFLCDSRSPIPLTHR